MNPVFEALREGQAIFGGTKDRETGRRFVLEYGKSFSPVSLPEGMPRGTPRFCFASAAKFILNHRAHGADGFRYVEGFAIRPKFGLLMAHAWIARDGQALDLTWTDNLDCYYFGVEFPVKALAAIISVRGYYGLLDPVDDFVRQVLGNTSSFEREAA